MTLELKARILSLFASGLGWEDAAAAEMWRAELFDESEKPGAYLAAKDRNELRTAVQKLWREYVSGKDAA